MEKDELWSKAQETIATPFLSSFYIFQLQLQGTPLDELIESLISLSIYEEYPSLQGLKKLLTYYVQFLENYFFNQVSKQELIVDLVSYMQDNFPEGTAAVEFFKIIDGNKEIFDGMTIEVWDEKPAYLELHQIEFDKLQSLENSFKNVFPSGIAIDPKYFIDTNDLNNKVRIVCRLPESCLEECEKIAIELGFTASKMNTNRVTYMSDPQGMDSSWWRFPGHDSLPHIHLSFLE